VHSGDGVGDVPLRPNGGASGSIPEEWEIAGENFAAPFRGGNAPLRRSGSRRRRCTSWRGGGSRAASSFEVAEPTSCLTPDNPVRCANASWDVTRASNAMFLGNVGARIRRCLLGLGHSISSHSSGSWGVQPSREPAHARVQSASARGSAEPSAHVIVATARFGSPSASPRPSFVRVGLASSSSVLAGTAPNSRDQARVRRDARRRPSHRLIHQHDTREQAQQRTPMHLIDARSGLGLEGDPVGHDCLPAALLVSAQLFGR